MPGNAVKLARASLIPRAGAVECDGAGAESCKCWMTPPVARQKRGEPQDLRHRLRTIKAYEYRDAATLLADFWETVDAVLHERGVIP
jgi:hypothetical protein